MSPFAGTIERFSGFADAYDRFRPEPPAVLAAILLRLTRVSRPPLVVDMGCGTGLSTRYWADQAREVIGIEPAADMRRQAIAHTATPNVTYREGFSHRTGLPDRCADIVTCAQALHWMEPQGTFREAARILRPGGVFAAFDYDWPPVTGNWAADAAYAACMKRARELELALPAEASVRQWDKSQHLARMQASGCFRYAREIVVHHEDSGNAERLVGLLLSQGGVMTLRKRGVSEEEIGITRFREQAQQALGDAPQTWYWSSRVRLGVA